MQSYVRKFSRPSGTSRRWGGGPGVETPGYFRGVPAGLRKGVLAMEGGVKVLMGATGKRRCERALQDLAEVGGHWISRCGFYFQRRCWLKRELRTGG
jgi:hypothetical protein